MPAGVDLVYGFLARIMVIHHKSPSRGPGLCVELTCCARDGTWLGRSSCSRGCTRCARWRAS